MLDGQKHNSVCHEVTLLSSKQSYQCIVTSLGITTHDWSILNGDLNIHIDKKNDSKAMELMNLLDSFELTQHKGSHSSVW